MARKNYWDDYYDYTPVKTTRGKWKEKYTGGWSRNSWSSFSFSSDFEDDNDNLYVKDPVNYLTPSSKEIRKKLSISKQSSINTVKELARVCYFKMIDDTDYVSEKFKENIDDAKKEMYDKIYENFIPGFTPLEQAVSIFLKMQNTQYDQYGDRIENEGPDFNSNLNFDREIYFDPTINEQLELNELSKERKMEIINHLSLVGKFGGEFKVEREISEKIVANSDQYSKMIMRDYSQFFMMDLYQKAFPNFKSKFLTKDLTVNIPVDRKEQIQKIIIILDYSGSMSEIEKQVWVNAMLIDRFKYVIKGEAEVFFSYFIYDIDFLNFQHIKNKEDVIKFWQTFSNQPNGGGTRVGRMVEHIAYEIENKRLCNLDIDLSEETPEILVINDGEDSIGTDAFPYKVNAVSLMCFNDELKDLCNATEGKQIYIRYDLKVFSYSKDVGEQEIKI